MVTRPVARIPARVGASGKSCSPVAAPADLLKQPPKAYWNSIPGYDPYAARREADRELASFNVMVNTLKTNADLRSRPLDAIYARQFMLDIEDNYVQALLNAGYSAFALRPSTAESR